MSIADGKGMQRTFDSTEEWIRTLTRIAMHGVHGKSGQTDGNVFGAAFIGSGVANPLASVSDDRLSGADVVMTDGMFARNYVGISADFTKNFIHGLVARGQLVLVVLDTERALENDSELVERGSLAGF